MTTRAAVPSRYRMRLIFVVGFLPLLIALILTFVVLLPSRQLRDLRDLSNLGVEVKLPLEWRAWWLYRWEGLKTSQLLPELHLRNSQPKIRELPEGAFTHVREYDVGYAEFEGVRLSAEQLTDIAAVSALSTLRFRRCELDVEGLEALGRESKVHMLSFDDCTLSEGSLSALAQLVSLRSLTLVRSGADFSELSAFKNSELGELRIGGQDIGVKEFQCVGTLPGLFRLELEDVTLRADSLLPLSGKALNYLLVENSNIETDALKSLSSWPSLESVTFYTCKLAAGESSYFELLSKLDALEVIACNVGDSDLVPISRMKVLRILHLDRSRVTGAGLSSLRLSPILELSLQGTSVGDQDLQLIAQIPNLEEINLRSTNVTKKGEATLKRLKPNLNVWR